MTNRTRVRRDFLRNLPLFGGVSLDACTQLASSISPVEINDGTTVYSAGETGESLYILFSGRVRLEQDQVILNQLSPGAHLGDLEFFDMAPRSFTARAEGPCEIWPIPFQAFDDLRRQDLRNFALIAMNAARQMSRRLREIDAERVTQHHQAQCD
jgi:CRP-like cAMP-binding protein